MFVFSSWEKLNNGKLHVTVSRLFVHVAFEILKGGKCINFPSPTKVYTAEVSSFTLLFTEPQAI